jgi:secondary thiamine-phosphate synthase enzyme
MKMKMHRGIINLQSHDHLPTFHEVTDRVREIVKESGIQNGIVVVYSHHTTCSVITQESSHDLNYWGREYMQQDLINVMEGLIPTCRTEGQYMHPGPKHIEFALSCPDEVASGSLNTDAHLRSVIFGRSETIILVDGEIQMGEFGYIYLIDWDQVRERKRVCQVQIMGE